MTISYISSYCNSQVAIYDLTNPAAPQSLGNFGGDGIDGPDDLAIYNNFLFIGNFAGNTISIYDITDPLNPVFKQLIPFVGQPEGLTIFNQYMYVSNQANNYIEIFDVSTTTDTQPPQVVAIFGNGSVTNPDDITISGNYLYVSNDISPGSITIFDLSNPVSPTFAGNFNQTGAEGLAAFDHYLYVANAIDNTIAIWDISTPTSPMFLTSFGSFPTIDQPDGIAVFEGNLYVTNFGGCSGNNEVTVYNLSTPIAPQLISSFNQNLSGPAGITFPFTSCIITCPADMTVTAPVGTTGANVAYPDPTTSGSCGTVSCSPPSGFFFPLGLTTVQCTSSIPGITPCSFTITVNPGCVINCPTDITVTAPAGATQMIVNYPTPTTTGSCGTVMCTPPSGSSFPVGFKTQVICSSDIPGVEPCSFNVTVLNSKSQKFTQPGTYSTTVPPNATSASISASGASGGNSVSFSGGKGAIIQGKLHVTPGDVLTIIVGEAGGGNASSGAGGGGATLIAKKALGSLSNALQYEQEPTFTAASLDLSTLLMIAGAGGGAAMGTKGDDASLTKTGTPGKKGVSSGSANPGQGGTAFSGGLGGLQGIGGNDGLPGDSPSTGNEGGGGGGGGSTALAAGGAGGGGLTGNGGKGADANAATGGSGGMNLNDGGAGGAAGLGAVKGTKGGLGAGGGGGAATPPIIEVPSIMQVEAGGGGGGGGGYSGGGGGGADTALLGGGGGGGGSVNTGSDTNDYVGNVGDGSVLITFEETSTPPTPTPNSAGLHVVRVPMVYDWTILHETIQIRLVPEVPQSTSNPTEET